MADGYSGRKAVESSGAKKNLLNEVLQKQKGPERAFLLLQ
jgi:hypothetical protein